jgi:16S rRNA (adenine1518-N6/adenine1519-N6)-dimethyltransferase
MALFLVQKEVGQRMAATPPDMNLLSLAIGLWGTATKLLSVPPNCFWPQPDVHSQLIALTPHPENRSLTREQREGVLSFSKPFFQNKRKQIGGILKRTYRLTEDEVQSITGTIGISAHSRPQELSVQQWIQLTERLAA